MRPRTRRVPVADRAQERKRTDHESIMPSKQKEAKLARKRQERDETIQRAATLVNVESVHVMIDEIGGFRTVMLLLSSMLGVVALLFHPHEIWLMIPIALLLWQPGLRRLVVTKWMPISCLVLSCLLTCEYSSWWVRACIIVITSALLIFCTRALYTVLMLHYGERNKEFVAVEALAATQLPGGQLPSCRSVCSSRTATALSAVSTSSVSDGSESVSAAGGSHPSRGSGAASQSLRAVLEGVPILAPESVPLPIAESSAIHRRLHSRLQQHSLLILVALLSPFMPSYCWPLVMQRMLYGNDAFVALKVDDTRLLSAFLSLYIAHLVGAASFPRDICGPSARRFIAPPISVLSIGRTIGVLGDLLAEMHVPSVSLLGFVTPSLEPIGGGLRGASWGIYVSTHVLLIATWLLAFARVLRGTFSWRATRQLCLTEGTLYIMCTVVLRALGPPSHYAPGVMSFAGAFYRGCISVSVAALMTPANREKIADIANRHAGWNHITMNLGDLSARPTDAAAQPEGEDAWYRSINGRWRKRPVQR